MVRSHWRKEYSKCEREESLHRKQSLRRDLFPKIKRCAYIATFLLLTFSCCLATESEEKVTLKWLGNAGWEIQLGKTIILIDPFLTRKDRIMDAEWKTDEAEVLKVIKGADYIFAGHSHHDHIGDVPFIAKRFGAKVIGSRTTVNLMLTAEVNPSQLVTIGGGESLIAKDFSVQVIESRHGWLLRNGKRVQPKSEEILEPKSRPLLGRDFVEGKSFLYYFTFGKHRVLHQSTGNFIEENLSGITAEDDTHGAGPGIRLAQCPDDSYSENDYPSSFRRVAGAVYRRDSRIKYQTGRPLRARGQSRQREDQGDRSERF